MSSSPSMHQPAIAGRIARPKSQHRDGGALRERLRASARASAAGSAACRRRRPAHRRARARSRPCAASTACAVPRRSACTKISAPGAGALGLGRHRVGGRPDHDRGRRCRRLRAARRAHAPAASGRRSRAGPSAARRACGCPRRPRARSQGKSVSTIALDHLKSPRLRLIRAGRGGKAGHAASQIYRRQRQNGGILLMFSTK